MSQGSARGKAPSALVFSSVHKKWPNWPVVARYDELNSAKITAICDPNLEFGRQRM